jgi:hypothetical protein
MSIIISLDPKTLDVLRRSAEYENISVNALARETLERTFSGKAAMILLEPAPPEEKMILVREAVNRVLNPVKEVQ